MGGLFLVIGFLTPLAAAAIIGVMFNAAVRVHLKNGIWNSNGGIELPFTYAAAALALAFTGPGPRSLDALFEWHLTGTPGGIGALVLGLVAGLIALSWRARSTETSAGTGVASSETQVA